MDLVAVGSGKMERPEYIQPVDEDSYDVGEFVGGENRLSREVVYEDTEMVTSEQIEYEVQDSGFSHSPAASGKPATFMNKAYDPNGNDEDYMETPQRDMEWGTYGGDYVPPLPSKAPVANPKASFEAAAPPKPQPRTSITPTAKTNPQPAGSTPRSAAVIRPNASKVQGSRPPGDASPSKSTNNRSDIEMPTRSTEKRSLCPSHLAIKVWLPVTIVLCIAFFIIGIVLAVSIELKCPKP